MKQKFFILLWLIVLGSTCHQMRGIVPSPSPTVDDTERLKMALAYFQSEKYQEALNLFHQLDKEYQLNPRYRAYIGLCHYQLWNYAEACNYLDSVSSALHVLAPAEQAVYYYANAESHFLLKEYQESITYFEMFLNVCHANEKADAYYRLGFCYLYQHHWLTAYEYFSSALSYYRQFGVTPQKRQRLVQLPKMLKGCKKHLEIVTETVQLNDSSHISIQRIL